MAYPPMTVAEAARALGVTRQRVHYLIRKGTLPAELVDAQWQVDRDAVQARAGMLEATSAWVTAEQVASAFGVTPKTVGKWHRRGLLPAVHALRHNQLLFNPRDVERFVPPRPGRPRS